MAGGAGDSDSNRTGARQADNHFVPHVALMLQGDRLHRPLYRATESVVGENSTAIVSMHRYLIFIAMSLYYCRPLHESVLNSKTE